jgi:hypothetical protein
MPKLRDLKKKVLTPAGPDKRLRKDKKLYR